MKLLPFVLVFFPAALVIAQSSREMCRELRDTIEDKWRFCVRDFDEEERHPCRVKCLAAQMNCWDQEQRTVDIKEFLDKIEICKRETYVYEPLERLVDCISRNNGHFGNKGCQQYRETLAQCANMVREVIEANADYD